MLFRKNVTMVEPADALPGRTDQTMPVPDAHYVNGNPLVGPWPEGMEIAVVGMGCFWGAERIFWQLDGVYSTFVGYAGGYTPNCTYEENCTGLTGHAEDGARRVRSPRVSAGARFMRRSGAATTRPAGHASGQRRRAPRSPLGVPLADQVPRDAAEATR